MKVLEANLARGNEDKALRNDRGNHAVEAREGRTKGGCHTKSYESDNIKILHVMARKVVK